MQTEQIPSVANKSGGDAISKDVSPSRLCCSRPNRVRKTYIGEATARRGHPSRFAIASSPCGLTRAGEHGATLANQLRGVDALAESSWPLSTKQAGAAESPFRHSRHGYLSGGVDLAGGEEPIMANQADHAPRRQRGLAYFSGGVDRPYGKTTN